jgi:hypothetical protein
MCCGSEILVFVSFFSEILRKCTWAEWIFGTGSCALCFVYRGIVEKECKQNCRELFKGISLLVVQYLIILHSTKWRCLVIRELTIAHQ